MKYYATATIGINIEHYYSVVVQFSTHVEMITFVNGNIDTLVAAGFERATEELRTCRYIEGTNRTIIMDYNPSGGTHFNG